MDDDGGDWFTNDADEAPQETATPAGAAATAEDAPAAGAGGDAAAQEDATGEAGEDKREEEDQYLDPDKLLIFKHWIRPKFLQYRYLYNYRHNYYDDVIDYLDKRQRGLSRDIPRAQTWAERALRTYTNKLNRSQSFKDTLEDTKLVTKTRLSGAFHSYHSKQYVNRRYSSILY